MTFNYVSLFSGIGGFEQALNKLGGNCVMASEIDKFANQSYEILYGHPTVGDITKVAAEDVPEHDLLAFGFPCQAFSVAGKRLGFEDTRGTLFFEAARIAKAKKPKVLLAENVKGLISHDKGKTLDTILQTLHDIGYTIDFNVINSKYFGVPQNRERIFIVAIRNDLIETDPWVIGKRTDVVAKGKRRITELGVNTFNFDWPAQEEVTVRLRDILESDVDEKYYLSEDKTAKLVTQLEERDQAIGDGVTPLNVLSRGAESKTDGTSYCIKAGRQHELIESEPRIDVVGMLELSKNERTNRVHSVDGICPTPSGLGQGGGTEPKIAEPQGVVEAEEVRPVLTPDRLEKRQNGRRFKEDGEEAFTLTAQDRHGVALSVKSLGNTNPSRNGMNGNVFDIDAGLAPTLTTNKGEGSRITSAPHYRIRKLTPKECFRLQSFPDEAFDKLVEAGISNSQLYRCAGNAVTVNVIDALGRRLLPYIDERKAE